MTKKLIIIFNSDVAVGKALNAVGHMCVGMGPRFSSDALPAIEVYAASADVVRAFRTQANALQKQLTEKMSVFSDFAHTTTEGEAKDHEYHTRQTKEADITYFAAGICAEEVASLDCLSQAVLIGRQAGSSQVDFKAPIVYPVVPTFVEDNKGFSIVLHPKLNAFEAIASLVKATITLASSEGVDLRLHQYPDADGSLHPGMSEYGLVVLKAKTEARLKELDKKQDNLDAQSLVKTDKLDAVALFGLRTAVKALTSKNISVWTGELVLAAKSPRQTSSLFIPAVKPASEGEKPADVTTGLRQGKA